MLASMSSKATKMNCVYASRSTLILYTQMSTTDGLRSAPVINGTRLYASEAAMQLIGGTANNLAGTIHYKTIVRVGFLVY